MLHSRFWTHRAEKKLKYLFYFIFILIYSNVLAYLCTTRVLKNVRLCIEKIQRTTNFSRRQKKNHDNYLYNSSHNDALYRNHRFGLLLYNTTGELNYYYPMRVWIISWYWTLMVRNIFCTWCIATRRSDKQKKKKNK